LADTKVGDAGNHLDNVDLTLTDDWSLADRVYQLLKKTILEGKIPLGARLIEKDLAQRLNVSRSPLREAIQRLQFEGLVRTVPRKGSYVIEFSEKELLDVFQVREHLEGLAAQLAADRMTPVQLDAIEQVLLQAQAVLGDDHASYPQASERDFHEAILDASRNDRLADMMRTLRWQFQLLRRRSGASHRRAHIALQEHFAILEALRAGDGELARQRMCEHIQNSMASTMLVLKSEGTGNVEKKAS
jgi:DNA-binding GntR family transcriptional regulator